MIRSLAIASDVMVEFGRTEVVQRPGRVLLRTPSQPNFWYGNALVLPEFSPDVDAQVAQFREDFPGATHVCIQWDVPNLRADLSAFEAAGFDVDDSDVLVLATAPRRFDLPTGITARPLSSDRDWQQAEELQHRTGVDDDGYSEELHRAYLRDRMAARRAQVDAGTGVWFGAFDGDLLVADMGVYSDGRLARFQSVETRKSHRRRGICAALVGEVVSWTRDRFPQAEIMIVADRNGDPGRIYRRCGFELRETVLAAVRSGY